MSSCTVMPIQLDKKRGGESMVLQETMNLANFQSLRVLGLGSQRKVIALPSWIVKLSILYPLKNEEYNYLLEERRNQFEDFYSLVLIGLQSSLLTSCSFWIVSVWRWGNASLTFLWRDVRSSLVILEPSKTWKMTEYL